MKNLIYIFILLLTCLPIRADIFTVDDNGPADFNNIQAAIDYSSDGDIIIVQPGHYDGRGKILYPSAMKINAIDFQGKNITLTSTKPSNIDIVSSTEIDAVVLFSGKEEPNCLLSGFKFSHNPSSLDRLGYIIGGNIFEYPEFVVRAQATIKNCILQRYPNGYAIYSCAGLIENCNISENLNISLIEKLIPAVYNCSGKIRNCTISNNYGGPAIFVGPHQGQLELENNIIYGNHYLQSYVQIYVSEGSSVSISYCDIQGGLEGIEGTGSVIWGPGNIDTDPCFAREGFWDTFEGDYHLKSQAGRWDPNTQNWVLDDVTSPCIDAGNPGCPLGSEPKDSNNVRIDVGAFGGTPLASKTPANWRSISDLTNDWLVDSNDLSVFTDYWLGTDKCLPSDLNRNLKVDFEDYAIFADNWLFGVE